MSKRSRYSAEEKYQIVRLFYDGSKTGKEILDEFGVHKRTIRDWHYQYLNYGIEALAESKSINQCSKEMKMQIVNEVLSGEISLRATSRKYRVPFSTVRKWIKNYNDHREITSTLVGRTYSMAKGRSTTWRERIDIVLFCLAHKRDYNQTAEVHKVSYQQVFQWVKKYDSGGEDALKDNRGKKKDPDQLSLEEKMRIENKKLSVENERLRAENAFLKKLEELERRRF